MPITSAHTPYGMLRFQRSISPAEKIYRSMRNSLQNAFDVTRGTDTEAEIYATARELAREGMALMCAGNQARGLTATSCLNNLEADFGITPGARDDLNTRRQRVHAKEAAAQGNSLAAMVAALRALLGKSFLAVRVLTSAEATVTPVTPLGDVRVAARPVTTIPRYAQLVDPVCVTGTPVWVTYSNLDSTTGEVDFIVGDTPMVQGENYGLGEQVTVLAVQGVGSARQFQATFTNSHDIGASVTTADWPVGTSTGSTYLIVVLAAASIDTNQRRLVDEYMASAVCGVDTWAIVQPTTPGALTIGPFTLGTSPLGAVPLGTTAFVLSS